MRDARVVDWSLDPEARDRYQLRATSQISQVVIHHSAVDVDSSTEELAEYHRRANKWPGVGYHFVIRWDGSIEYAGDLATNRYHVGIANLSSVGVCLVGDFTHHHPTPEQLGAAVNLVAVLMPLLDPAESGNIKVVGHKEIAPRTAPTSCPGATWPEWENAFRRWRPQ